MIRLQHSQLWNNGAGRQWPGPYREIPRRVEANFNGFIPPKGWRDPAEDLAIVCVRSPWTSYRSFRNRCSDRRLW
jgi:hypothetical protein